MAEAPKSTISARRRLPGTRWSAIRVNWRWAVQALALLAGIYFFKQAFDVGKALAADFSTSGIPTLSVWVLLFALCFFALMFTSYLKERGVNTLKNRIAIFEKLVVLLHLEKYVESGSENQPSIGAAKEDDLSKNDAGFKNCN
jgi:hypothetical protein